MVAFDPFRTKSASGEPDTGTKLKYPSRAGSGSYKADRNDHCAEQRREPYRPEGVIGLGSRDLLDDDAKAEPGTCSSK